MLTVSDIQAHPLHPLFTEVYDNADVAFALSIPTFADWRKSMERQGCITLPRIDANPARPRFRLAHVYEYGLLKALSSVTTAKTAGQILRTQFDRMLMRFGYERSGIAETGARFDDELLRIILGDETFDEWNGENEAETVQRRHHGVTALFPWAVFDESWLDRTAERRANPQFLVVSPEWAVTDRAANAQSTPYGTKTLVEAVNHLDQSLRASTANPDLIGRQRIAVVVNITELLADIDERLTHRLKGRSLKGRVE